MSFSSLEIYLCLCFELGVSARSCFNWLSDSRVGLSEIAYNFGYLKVNFGIGVIDLNCPGKLYFGPGEKG